METETRKCHNCERELQIPKNISLQKDTDYEKFYVSPGGMLYCNRNCFMIFTED